MRIRPVVYLAIFPLAIFIGILHTLAIENYFYWKFFWFDMLVHTSAGALAGILSYMIARQYVPRKKAAIFGLCGSLVVGGFWEFFEYINGVSQYQPGFWFDTWKDMLMDALGGGIAAIVCARRNI